MILFGSIAGCFGNPGQADYALANEILARYATAWWHRGIRATVIHWSPWQLPDSGMVTTAIADQFAKQGVTLLTAEQGRFFFDREWVRPTAPEVIAGPCPYAFRETSPRLDGPMLPTDVHPLLRGGQLLALGKGEWRFHRTLDFHDVPYLDECRENDEPSLLPMVAVAYGIALLQHLFPHQAVGLTQWERVQRTQVPRSGMGWVIELHSLTSRQPNTRRFGLGMGPTVGAGPWYRGFASVQAEPPHWVPFEFTPLSCEPVSRSSIYAQLDDGPLFHKLTQVMRGIDQAVAHMTGTQGVSDEVMVLQPFVAVDQWVRWFAQGPSTQRSGIQRIGQIHGVPQPKGRFELRLEQRSQGNCFSVQQRDTQGIPIFLAQDIELTSL